MRPDSRGGKGDRDKFGLYWLTEYHRIIGRKVHVQFTPNTEVSRKIDSRFDRETGTGQQPASILRFQIVDVCAIAMDFFT